MQRPFAPIKAFLKSLSLKDLLLVHELIFIALVLIAVAAGGIGIHLRDKSFQESQRINLLIREIQETRGDLYRQMKELFDVFFLGDEDGMKEYAAYTQSIEHHFDTLKKISADESELNAILDLQKSYHVFVNEAPALFHRYEAAPNAESRKSIYDDIETDIFNRYEQLSLRTEKLLARKQSQLDTQLEQAKRTSRMLFAVPLILSGLLLFFSRGFLNFGIVRPINRVLHATKEISSGRLSNQVPLSGSAELIQLSGAINKMAEDLKTSQDALIRTEKQAALGLLVPMLAHNIRNPLSSIRATAQVAQSPELDHDTKESLAGIMSTVDRLERWIGSLLAYLHPVKPQLEHVTLKSILDGTMTTLAGKISEKEVSIQLPSMETQRIRLLTDQHLLEQVLYNLLLNAIEASPKSAHIWLDAEITPQKIVLSIADQGLGMTFTPTPKASGPGPTTKRFGTGLGIPFAFKVCEELGGNIEFMPREGGGTRVILTLPQP